MVNFSPLSAEIDRWVWGTPANFDRFRILASLLHRRHSTEANQTLHDVWPHPGLVHCVHFWGSCPLMEFCQVQISLCDQVLHSPILAALLHCTQAVGVSQTLRRSTRNGIKELLWRAPPVFARAATTLGIGPHSSYTQWTIKTWHFIFDYNFG